MPPLKKFEWMLSIAFLRPVLLIALAGSALVGVMFLVPFLRLHSTNPEEAAGTVAVSLLILSSVIAARVLQNARPPAGAPSPTVNPLLPILAMLAGGAGMAISLLLMGMYFTWNAGNRRWGAVTGLVTGAALIGAAESWLALLIARAASADGRFVQTWRGRALSGVRIFAGIAAAILAILAWTERHDITELILSRLF